MSEPISVRARFERFPATVKGAFIIRGEDRDPHQVVFREARVVAIGGAQTHPIAMAVATLDVAPRRDVFVPFEMTVTESSCDPRRVETPARGRLWLIGTSFSTGGASASVKWVVAKPPSASG